LSAGAGWLNRLRVGRHRASEKFMKYFISALLVSALSLPAFAQSEAVKMPTSPLSIVTADKTISLTVEVADEQHELATGYMFREGVEDGTGMLFDFGDPREANMYMRNVPFGLDMLFLDTSGKVVAMAKHVQPESERRINPGFAVKGVLELAEGQIDVLGIQPGDRVEHPIFKSDDADSE
tara:strand:+ start:199 stop:738 length:540 start_codon:yes stop_codon:yes gene_type:complete